MVIVGIQSIKFCVYIVKVEPKNWIWVGDRGKDNKVSHFSNQHLLRGGILQEEQVLGVRIRSSVSVMLNLGCLFNIKRQMSNKCWVNESGNRRNPGQSMNLGVLSHEVQSAHRGSEKSTTRTGFLGTQTFSSQSSEEEPVKTKRPRENGKRRIKRQWYHTRQVKKILQGRSHQLYNATDRSSNMRTQI